MRIIAILFIIAFGGLSYWLWQRSNSENARVQQLTTFLENIQQNSRELQEQNAALTLQLSKLRQEMQDAIEKALKDQKELIEQIKTDAEKKGLDLEALEDEQAEELRQKANETLAILDNNLQLAQENLTDLESKGYCTENEEVCQSIRDSITRQEEAKQELEDVRDNPQEYVDDPNKLDGIVDNQDERDKEREAERKHLLERQDELIQELIAKGCPIPNQLAVVTIESLLIGASVECATLMQELISVRAALNTVALEEESNSSFRGLVEFAGSIAVLIACVIAPNPVTCPIAIALTLALSRGGDGGESNGDNAEGDNENKGNKGNVEGENNDNNGSSSNTGAGNINNIEGSTEDNFQISFNSKKNRLTISKDRFAEDFNVTSSDVVNFLQRDNIIALRIFLISSEQSLNTVQDLKNSVASRNGGFDIAFCDVKGSGDSAIRTYHQVQFRKDANKLDSPVNLSIFGDIDSLAVESKCQ